MRSKIQTFHENAEAGRYDLMLRDYFKPPGDFPHYMRTRAGLGRMVRTTEVDSQSGSGYYGWVRVLHNTEFERGHAFEDFQFRVDGAAVRLNVYNYQIGKRLACPAVRLLANCRFEDAPRPALHTSR